ncbi:trehalase family glycosidase [Paenibacillus sp. HB172176]|uniref:MGH1-like glycoside hydrolase domain-containing protein n=1 Tax=Paenibacillus sp. HB172176 TaxID=2493690 RepID=UPI00143A0306|nr:trehalase family glycosidase [Paenibacillus sp. HB172176]
MSDNHEQIVRNYLKEKQENILRKPEGKLRFPFLEPGGSYRGVLWDWDSYFAGIGMQPEQEGGAYLKGCLLNFLDHIREDGFIPYHIQANLPEIINPDSPLNVGYRSRSPELPFNTCKPILAQMALAASRKLDDFEWLRSYYGRLEAYIKHWEETQLSQSGLFVWRSHRGSGADNHPAVYGRPLNSSAGVDLNALFVREYSALAILARTLHGETKAETYLFRQRKLAEAVNKHLWDPVDHIYYHADAAGCTPPLTNQQVGWVVPLKYKAWTAFLPMWAKIAPHDYAESMVNRYLLQSDRFFSEHGIRTLASDEPLYHLKAMSNPSNWQGPVWIVSNYLVFRSVLNYGYVELAQAIAEKTLRMLSLDIGRTGTLHEYYHPDTGEGIMNPDFLNWNLLADSMMLELEQNRDLTAL